MRRSKMTAAVIFVAVGFALVFVANMPSALSQDRPQRSPQGQSPPPPPPPTSTPTPTPTMQKGTLSAERAALIAARKACLKACRDKYIQYGNDPATGKPLKVPTVDEKGLEACVAKCPKCISNTVTDCY